MEKDIRGKTLSLPKPETETLSYVRAKPDVIKVRDVVNLLCDRSFSKEKFSKFMVIITDGRAELKLVESLIKITIFLPFQREACELLQRKFSRSSPLALSDNRVE